MNNTIHHPDESIDHQILQPQNPQVEEDQQAWLPITASRNANLYNCVFHLLSSGFGIQALLLPVSFSTLGWAWGIICFLLAFTWQLYTIWVLVQLHESVPGVRYSRFLHIATSAFGKKLGILLALFPVGYLSGGSCVMLMINGGRTMRLFYYLMCDGDISCEANSPSGAQWFLVFMFIAIILAQFPTLNSIAGLSFIGGFTAIFYMTMIWGLSIAKGKPYGVIYDSQQHEDDYTSSSIAKFSDVLVAIGIIAISFRGHNLVLEIQGTLPSNFKRVSKKAMWRGVKISYALIAMSLLPLAIVGHWAYGDKVTRNGGILTAFFQYNAHNTSKRVKGLIYMLIVINNLTSFPIYAMPILDTWESKYTGKKKRQCPWWLRAGLRLLFGGVVYLIAVAFPFLPSLAILVGGIVMPLTYAYPCFMWILIKRPGKSSSAMWWMNLVVGCLGVALSVLVVAAESWSLHKHGLKANFFNP